MGFARQSLEILERERPAHYAQLVQSVGVLHTTVSSDGDCFEVRVLDGKLRLNPQVDVTALQHPPPAPGHIRVHADRSWLLSLLDGADLIDALTEGHIAIHGAVDDLLRARDAFVNYLAGLVRCQQAPGLLQQFRTSTNSLAIDPPPPRDASTSRDGTTSATTAA